MLRFEVLQAQYGDCFVMRWRDSGQDRLAVIDGGPSGVYANLKRRLLELKGAIPTLIVDWAMVSHIDDDHINGLLEMMTALRNARDNGQVAPFRVRRFWFNSFDDLAKVAPGGHGAATAAVASLGNSLPAGVGLSHDTQAVLASVGQGRGLRDALDALNIGDNAPVGGLLKSGAAPVDINGLQVTIVGPLEQQLKDLQNDWAKAPKARTAEAASYADKSIANLSSLVCHVAYPQAGSGRTMLLTGDARGDYVLTGLEQAGLLKNGKLKLDLVKVQHHGSDRDVVKDFFACVTADHYVISANGKYNNPDKDTLTWLVQARADAAYTIHISNRQPWMDAFFAALKPGRNFSVKYRGELDDNTSIDEIDLD